MKSKIYQWIKYVLHFTSLLILTLSVNIINDVQLFAQGSSILNAEFAFGNTIYNAGIYVCRGYYFTPTQDIFLDRVFGGAWDDTDSKFKISIYELNTNVSSVNYTVESIVTTHEFFATGYRTYYSPGNTITLKKDTGYLIAQGRMSGGAKHISKHNSVNSNDIGNYINMIDSDARSIGTTNCNFSAGSQVNNSTKTNRVDIGFTYFINSLSFDSSAGGVSNPSSIVAVAGSTITLPVVTQEGYSFDGWFTEATGGTQISSTSMPSGLTTYYAQWTPNSYSIQFQGNESSSGSMENQPVTYDQSVNLSNNSFAKVGYTFAGWNTQADGMGVDSFANEETVTNMTSTDDETVILYAQWEANDYEVTFDSLGGSGGTQTIDATFDAPMPSSVSPSKIGHSFMGYFDQVSGQGIQYYNADMSSARNYTIPGITTLYAHWTINQYTLDFESNGGTTYAAIVTDFNADISSPGTPDQFGYVFDQWYLDDALTTPYAFSTMPSENTTAYAGWTLTPFDIDYDLSAGTNNPSNPDHYDVEDSTFFIGPATKNGFTFDGWEFITNTPSNLSAAGILSINPTTSGISASVHQYRLVLGNQTWESARDYCATEGGYLATVTTSLEWDYILQKILQNSNPDDLFWLGAEAIDKRAGLSSSDQNWQWLNNEGPVPLNDTEGFENWAEDEPNNSGGEFYLTTWNDQAWNDLDNNSKVMNGFVCEFDETIQLSGNITLQAVYVANSYTITLDTDGGDSLVPLNFDTEESISLPSPTRGDDFFIGWYSDASFITPFTIETMPPNDLTLYARYTDVFYSVNYLNVLNGTNSTDNPVDFTEFTPTISLATASRVGYTFDGWFTTVHGTGTAITSIAIGTTEDMNLYAKWTPIPYSLTFNSSGGSNVSTIHQGYETLLTLPTPNKAGFRFTGWFEEGTRVTYTTMPLNGGTLTARWTPITYTLTLTNNVNGDQSTIQTTYQSPITLPIVSIPGYTFRGWFESGNAVAYSTMPLGNKTLLAILQPNSYTIRFNTGSAGAISPIEAAYGSSVRLPSVSLENHSFDGWFMNGSKVNLTTMPLNGATLTAQFTPLESTITFINPSGDAPGALTTFIGETIQLPTVNKTGHTFDGWYDGDTRASLTTMPELPITLTARFTINQYTLTVNGFNGQRINQITTDYGEAVTLPVPEQLGYLFAGWTLNGQTISGNQIAMPEGGGTVSARFDPILYPVSWMYKDDTVQMNLPFDSDIPLPSTHVTGYAFEGWQQNGSFIDSTKVPLRGTTVTAIYRAYQTIQTFYLPGQTTRLTLTTDEAFNGPNLNVPSNLFFGGYYTQPFGLGEALSPGDVIENGWDARSYPHIYNPSTAVQIPGTETLFTGTLRTLPNNHDTVPPTEPLEIPWLSISVWGFMLSGLIILYERGRRHG